MTSNGVAMKASNGVTTLLWKCTVYSNEKSEFITKEKTNKALSQLGIRTLFS